MRAWRVYSEDDRAPKGNRRGVPPGCNLFGTQRGPDDPHLSAPKVVGPPFFIPCRITCPLPRHDAQVYPPHLINTNVAGPFWSILALRMKPLARAPKLPRGEPDRQEQ